MFFTFWNVENDTIGFVFSRGMDKNMISLLERMQNYKKDISQSESVPANASLVLLSCNSIAAFFFDYEGISYVAFIDIGLL